MKTDLHILILAAGESRRMGEPKQLLDLGGETLLERSIRIAQASQAQSVHLVLGAQAESILKKSKVSKVQVYLNPDYKKGMGRSLKVALKEMLRKFSPSALLLMVGDQPELSTEYLNRMIQSHQAKPQSFIASAYAQTWGVPVIYPNHSFDDLGQVPDAGGAKKLLYAQPEKVIALDFPAGAIDLDTPEEYQNWLKNKLS